MTANKSISPARWMLVPLGLVLPAFLLWVILNAPAATSAWQWGVAVGIGAVCNLLGWLTLLRKDAASGWLLFFLLVQAMGLALGAGMLFLTWESAPRLLSLAFAVGGFLTPSIYLHYRLNVPVQLLKKGRGWLALLYLPAAAGIPLAVLRPTHFPLNGLVILALSYGLAGIITGWGVYIRQATPSQRQQLRVGSVGLTIALGIITLGTLVPHWSGWYSVLIPDWTAVALLVLAPLGWSLPRTLRSLYTLDRVLNKFLLSLLLLAIVFGVIGAYMTWLFPWLPPSPWVRSGVTGAIALALGAVFPALMRGLQRSVDRLFYKGTYQETNLVEKANQLLAGVLSRRELNQALTRDIPGWLRLSGAQLWFGEAAYAPTLQGEAGGLNFELVFQAKVRAVWTLFPHQDGRPFSTRERQTLAQIVKQAEVALRNVLLVENLRRRLDEIRAGQDLLAQAQQQLIRSRDNERARLARDLHDGPIQSLVALNLTLGLMEPDHSTAGQQIGAALTSLRAEVKALIGELREVCAELRPPLLDTLGLGPALESLVTDWGEESRVTTQTAIGVSSEILALLPDEIAVNIYRIVQEALHNIGKHARAQRVDVELFGDAQQIVLEIIDDGAGFAVPDTFRDLTQQGHFGLVGMRERVNLIGGKWELTSLPGEGTRILVTIPVPSALTSL